jgi:hypothetical protein
MSDEIGLHLKIIQDCYGKSNFEQQQQQQQQNSSCQQIELNFQEETSEVLHLVHSFV